MGRPMRRALLLVAIAVTSTGGAQDVPPATLQPTDSQHGVGETASGPDATGAAAATRRRVRIAALVARFNSLSHAAADSATSRWDVVTTDTLDAGIYRIRTTPALRARVVRAALRASRELQFSLDAHALATIRDADIAVLPMGDDDALWQHASLLAGARGGSRSCCELPAASKLRRDPLEATLRDLAVELVSQSFDGALSEWLLRSPLPILSEPGRPEPDARIDLGTSESAQARGCIGGSDHACALLLDLHGRPLDPLTTWYAHDDHRALVTRLRLAPTDGGDAPQRQRACLAGDSSSCDALLRALDPSRIPAPTMQGPRLSLLRHALQAGGDGALERLRHTSGDIGARLAAASRYDEARLLASWRAALVDPASAAVRPTAPAAVASFCWMLLVTGLGLRRMKRCR